MEEEMKVLKNVLKKRSEHKDKEDLPTYVCSICGKTFTGYGNNAEPINSGRCCNSCNQLVILERIKQMQERRSKEND